MALVEESIRQKLMAAFNPLRLEVENESAKHAGHASMKTFPGAAAGETHFRVFIVADIFAGKRLIERHRFVNDVLKDELAGPVHALAIKAQTPDEMTQMGLRSI